LSNRIIKLAAEEQDFEHELLGYYLRAVGFFKLRNLQEAMDSSNKALAGIEQLSYIESPQISIAEIYYRHSRIAAALGQADTAQTYLQKAYTEIMSKANLIGEEALHKSFLNDVPLNQEILAAIEQNL
jgi:tetratricopeptide (TPR) repeat protein